MTELPTKKPLGGKRPGAGRPKGALNKATLERQRNLQREIEVALASMPADEIDGMDSVQILEYAMHAYMRSGNLDKAVAVAKELGPYQRSRLASSTGDGVPLPEDLLPDVPACPDEPGPASPVE